MTINVNDVRDLVQELDGVVAVADASMPTLVIDVLRIRRAYGLGPPSALSSYARAIERVEDGDTSDLSSELIIAAAAFCKAELAPRLAEAAIANDVTDVPRLAALLAIQDLERLEQLLTHSHGDELVISTTEAYLALVDARRAIPPELERRWSAIEHAANPTGEHYSARLRLAARRDPVAAMTLLGEAIVEVGVNDVSSGVAAVMTRAVRVDRTHAWNFMRAERPCEARAFILEALVRGEPDAHELEPMLVDVIAQWRDRGWGSDRSPIGAMGMVMPLLAACATAGRLDLAATVRDTFGPSPVARPIAICATRCATSRNVNTAAGMSTSARCACAQRRRVDHPVPHATLGDTQIRARTRAGVSAMIPHNVIAIAIATRL